MSVKVHGMGKNGLMTRGLGGEMRIGEEEIVKAFDIKEEEEEEEMVMVVARVRSTRCQLEFLLLYYT